MRRVHTYIFTVKAGKEKKTLRDIYDLLFPSDIEVRHRDSGFSGLFFIYTSIKPNMLTDLLKKYPIRHIINVKYVLLERNLSMLNKILSNKYFSYETKKINICLCSIKFRGVSRDKKKEIYSFFQRYCKNFLSIKRQCFLEIFEKRLYVSIKIFNSRKNTKI